MADYKRGDRLRLTKGGESTTGTVRWCEPGIRFCVDLDGVLSATYLATADWLATFSERYGATAKSSFELIDDFEIEVVK